MTEIEQFDGRPDRDEFIELFSVPGQSVQEKVLYGRRLQTADGTVVPGRFGGRDYWIATSRIKPGEVIRVSDPNTVGILVRYRYFTKMK